MDVSAAAAELLDMRRAQRVEPDLPADLRPTDLAAAYAIQAALVGGLGGDPIGYKCACTSPIAQEALKIDRPIFGQLLSQTTSESGVTLDASRFVHRVDRRSLPHSVCGRGPPPERGFQPLKYACHALMKAPR